jgi:hypothetical protein
LANFSRRSKTSPALALSTPFAIAPSMNLGRSLRHLLGDLLAHGAAQEVGAAERVARHDLRDLHHLFLVDDDALRLLQDVVDGGVDRFEFALAVLHLAIGGDVLHRAGTVERDEGHDILDAGGLHAPQRIHHARAFHLEDGDGAGAGVELVGLSSSSGMRSMSSSTPRSFRSGRWRSG